jgi:hypothetical protein
MKDKNKKYLPNDVSRCSNNTCSLRTDCKRYLQFENDKNNFTVAPITYFLSQDDKCGYQLKVNT